CSPGTNYSHWASIIPLLLRSQLRQIKDLHIPADRSVEFSTDSSVDFGLHALGIVSASQISPSRARTLGETIGARIVIWGRFRRLKDSWEILMKALDLPNGRAITDYKVNCSDLMQGIQNMRRALTQDFQITVNPEQEKKMNELPTTSAGAIEFFSKAFDARIN